MRIPSNEAIVKRLNGNYLDEGCDYFPCHRGLETCNLCFCIFYPCRDTNLGKYITSKKGTEVWSCMKCEWIHRKDTIEKLKAFLEDGKNHGQITEELYLSFVKSTDNITKK